MTTGLEKSFEFTSSGRPVFIAASCCMQGTAANHWVVLSVSRDGVELKSSTIVCSASSYNSNATLIYLDQVEAGTYTYTFNLNIGAGTITYNEVNLEKTKTQPEIIIFEI